MCRCLIPQCPYNSKGYCSARETIIGADGVCTWLHNSRWQEPVNYKEEISVITLAKREEKEDDSSGILESKE